MIIAERKPFDVIMGLLEPFDKVLLVGCKGCVTVCSSGGKKEVGVLSAEIKLRREKEGKPIEVTEVTLERQCDPEYLTPLADMLKPGVAILSMACGAGVQFVAEHYKTAPVYPALNTTFIGVTEESGHWAERCQACGDCKLHLTGGICPIARCSKSLLNGPCGGSMNGVCEISKDVPCGWQLIIDRLEALGLMDNYEKISEANDWRTSRDGGPRICVREDLE